MPYVPRVSSSLLFSFGPRQGYSFSLGVYRQSDMSWLGDGGNSEGYIRPDARLARSWSAKHVDAKLEFIVQNAGQPYMEFSDRNLFETFTYVRLTVQAE